MLSLSDTFLSFLFLNITLLSGSFQGPTRGWCQRHGEPLYKEDTATPASTTRSPSLHMCTVDTKLCQATSTASWTICTDMKSIPGPGGLNNRKKTQADVWSASSWDHFMTLQCISLCSLLGENGSQRYRHHSVYGGAVKSVTAAHHRLITLHRFSALSLCSEKTLPVSFLHQFQYLCLL